VAVRLVVVGRPRGPLADAAAEYERRIGRALRFEVREVREEPLQQGSAAEVMARERARLAPHLDGWTRVCLDRRGRTVDSEALATLLGELEERPPGRSAWVVGGSVGLDPALLDEAEHVLSLGAVTLPHALARVVLAEQLYRATTILRGEPYHR
jgi:23S rRNA (pseudouridine1915-N3)-methyltransferase